MPHATSHLALVVSAVFLLVGCTGGSASCPSPSVRVEATVTDEAMVPQAVTVCRGQEVTLEVLSQTDGTLHVHGYDDQVPATTMTPGQSVTLLFTAESAGQFIIELHAASGLSSTEIGVLTVDEP